MDKDIISKFFNTDKTMAKELFDGKRFPHEILPELKNYICKLGKTLPADRYTQVKENVWIAKNATVAESAYISGPCIIDDGAEVRHCAFIRGSVIVGRNSVVGNSTELKNCLIFDSVQVPHYNYVGDSILGYKSHMGAGSITSNVKNDKSHVKVSYGGEKLETGLKKVGAIIGDHAEIGCGSVLNPGSVIGKNSSIYPLSSIRGYVGENSIYKKASEIVLKYGEEM